MVTFWIFFGHIDVKLPYTNLVGQISIRILKYIFWFSVTMLIVDTPKANDK